MNASNDMPLTCPIPVDPDARILLSHGSGGKQTLQLIEELFTPAFGSDPSPSRHDGAVLELPSSRIAFTTDSFVVNPLFFPGGDIGSLSVNGTVNDLAMCGAEPLFLSVGFILEEGLPMETLRRVVRSLRKAADEAGVRIVTGDTKVVERGRGHGLYLNTTGIGVLRGGDIGPEEISPGDQILLSGDIGRHGIAVLGEREGLSFETPVASDTAPLSGMVLDLIAEGISLHCLRDLTRGGLGGALVELSRSSGLSFRIAEERIPLLEEVRGACELLGLDPLHVANEGRFILFVPRKEGQRAVEILKRSAQGRGAVKIGEVLESGIRLSGEPSGVLMKTTVGTLRRVEMLSGEQLPRIC